MNQDQMGQWRVKVDNQVLVSGEDKFAAEIFNSLRGIGNSEDFGSYLETMSIMYGQSLRPLGELKLIRPDGVLKSWASVGDGVDREDPIRGEQCFVKTYPMGRAPEWSKTIMSDHKAETPLNNELFYFAREDTRGCYPVLRSELQDRVMSALLVEQLGQSKIPSRELARDRISVGDMVQHCDFWGKEDAKLSRIVDMELCAEVGQKHGQNVTSVDVVDKDRLNVVLDNGKWAYGYQIQQVGKPFPVRAVPDVQTAGEHHGPIKSVVGDVVIQSAGAGRTVTHDARKLDVVPKEGDRAAIKYDKDSKGVVTITPERGVANGRGR